MKTSVMIQVARGFVCALICVVATSSAIAAGRSTNAAADARMTGDALVHARSHDSAGLRPQAATLDLTLAQRINKYRADQGLPSLRLSYQLTYVAAAHVQILMLNMNSGKVIPTNRLVPGNYAWQTTSAWGTDEVALRLNSTEAVFSDLKARNNELLLTRQHNELGAVWECSDRACGYYLIVGHGT